jgi:hypothetical protein
VSPYGAGVGREVGVNEGVMARGHHPFTAASSAARRSVQMV